MQYIFTLTILSTFYIITTSTTSQSELIQIACSRNPNLRFCKNEQLEENKSTKKVESNNKVPFSTALKQLSSSQEPHFRIFGEKLKELKIRPFNDDALPSDDADFDLEPEKSSPDTRSGLRLGGREDEERFSALMNERKNSENKEKEKTSGDIDHTGHIHKPEDAGFFIPESGPTIPPKIESEDVEKGLEVYCKKYEENYVYYCRTKDLKESKVSSHLYKFCPSYEANCPTKAQEYHSEKPQVPKELQVFETLSQLGRPPPEQFDLEKEKLLKRYPCKPDCDVRIHKHCTTECKCDYIYPVVQKFCNPPPVPFFLNTCKIWYHGCPKYLQYFYSSQYIHSKAEKGKVWNGPQFMPQTRAAAPPEEMPIVPDPFDIPHNHPIVERGSKTIEASKILRKKLEEKKARDDPFESIETRDDSKNKLIPITRSKTKHAKAFQSPSFSEGNIPQGDDYHKFDYLTDSHGMYHEKHSRSPFSKPGLWTANPDNPHNRDHANKYWYHPESVQADFLNGQLAWGAHWAVPAFGVGGTDGFSSVHFPTIGNFFDIPDDYD
uniref:CPW-WPC family protein n=1 Tax=Parastrongyloides trichosuri TaxID=131310 RepID=A0A0N4ZYT5_PARTI